MTSNHDEESRSVSRRKALQAIGAATVGSAMLTGSASAKPAHANGEGEGRPTVSVSSPECGQLRFTRNASGPAEGINLTLTSDTGEERGVSVWLDHTTNLYDVAAGTWTIESTHPALAVEPSTVTVEECAPPPEATLTLEAVEGRCGAFTYTRNDVGPEIINLSFEVNPGWGDRYWLELPAARGETHTFELAEGGTVAAGVIMGGEDDADGVGWEDVEVIGSPVSVESCE